MYSVDQQASVPVVQQIRRRTVQGREHTARISAFTFIGSGPFGSNRRFVRIRFCIGLHALQRLGLRQYRPVVVRFGVVRPGFDVHILDALQNRVVALFGNGCDACALLVIFTVVPDPRLAQNLPSEAF